MFPLNRFFLIFFCLFLSPLCRQIYSCPANNIIQEDKHKLEPPGEKNIYVDPVKGKDSFAGTEEMPFRSLVKAKSFVKEWNKTNGNENINIWLHGGEYSLKKTLVFGLEDGAKSGQSISYRAIPGEIPIINSDIPVSGWKKLKTLPRGLPEIAKEKVWVANLPEGIKPFNTLYNSQQMLPRASSKGFPHLREKLAPDDKLHSIKNRDDLYSSLPFDKEAIKEIFNPENTEIRVIPAFAWVMNILPVESIDAKKGMVYLGAKSTYPLHETHYFPSDEAIIVENCFAGLDSPGEWVYSQEENSLYYWPLDGDSVAKDIVIPQLVEMIRVEGKIDYNGDTDIPVKGLHFKGITFTHAKRFELSGQTGMGLQHDWEKFDASTALIRFRGAENCTVENCLFKTSGGSGIRFDLHAQYNTVTGNEICNIGGTGILFAGYGPGVKNVSVNNNISNNYIHHIGELWPHSMGIWLWQSGNNLISHNTIHDIPYTAIAVTGRIIWNKNGTEECSGTIRWHEVGAYTGNESWVERERFMHGRRNIIENNDIYHIMKVMHDGNGVYLSGAGKGNIVRGNYVHDTPREAGGEAIRCDDDQHDVLIENNIVFRFHTFGTGLCSKGRNHIINNIVACPPGKVERGMLSLEPNYAPNLPSKLCAGSVIKHNIFYATKPDQPFVYMQGIANCIDNIIIDSNIYFNKSDLNAADAYFNLARKYDNEVHSIQSDPLFVDPTKGDFDLLPNSPASDLGFRPFRLDAGISQAADFSPAGR